MGEHVPTSGDNDTPDRWVIRNVNMADRDAANLAAKRAKATLAEWLGRAIRHYVEAERQGFPRYVNDTEMLPALLDTPTQPIDVPMLQELAQVVLIARQIHDMRGAPPQRLLGTVTRLLIDHVRRSTEKMEPARGNDPAPEGGKSLQAGTSGPR